MRGKMPKISIIGHFLSRTSLKKFSDKIFVDNKKVFIILSIFKKYVLQEDNSSFKGFKFFIFKLPVFSHTHSNFLMQIPQFLKL